MVHYLGCWGYFTVVHIILPPPPSPSYTLWHTPLWSRGSVYSRIYDIFYEISSLTPLSFTNPLLNIILVTINMNWYWKVVTLGKLSCPTNVISWVLYMENNHYGYSPKGFYITLGSSKRLSYSIIAFLYPLKMQLNVKRVWINKDHPLKICFLIYKKLGY